MFEKAKRGPRWRSVAASCLLGSKKKLILSAVAATMLLRIVEQGYQTRNRRQEQAQNDYENELFAKWASSLTSTVSNASTGASDSSSSSSTFFPNMSYFDVFSAEDAAPIAVHYATLLEKYKDEIVHQWKYSDQFWKDAAKNTDTSRCVGRVGKIEGTMLYMMIREDKPSHVFEVGALCGASTRYILEALEKNGKGKLSTFDLHDYSLEYMHKRHTEQKRWEFHYMDVFDYITTHEGKQMMEEIDLIFIDALHRNEFAQKYTTQILAKHKSRVSVFVHDIYAPFLIPPYKKCQKTLSVGDLQDEISCIQKTADTITKSKEYYHRDTFYGPTQAGGEGSELLSWLARTGRSKGIVTFSPYAATDFSSKIRALYNNHGMDMNAINNPAIFFELNPLN
jgi:predicted O-methyltransferase YrrM